MTTEHTGMHYPGDFNIGQKLYVGNDAERFEVRERFEENEKNLQDIAQRQSSSNGAAAELSNRIETLENEQQTVKDNQTELAENVAQTAESLDAHTKNADQHVNNLIRNHPNNASVHVDEFLRGHPDNPLVHVPALGGEGQVLGVQNGLLKFIDHIVQECDNVGIVGITPDAVIAALGEYTASRWTLIGKPLGATRIRTAHFASNRFLIGGDDGNASASWDASRWTPTVKLFDDPIEGFATGRLPDGGKFLIPVSEGDIFRTEWTVDGFNWARQTSSKTITKGVRKIAYLENRY